MIRTERLQLITVQDLAQINLLLSQLTTKPCPLELLTAKHIAASSFWIVARDGEVEGQPIVGMASLIKNRHPAGYSGLLEDVVVLDSYRRRGIAEELWRVVVETARGEGMKHIDFTCKPSRAAAHAFYDKMGCERRDTVPRRLNL